MDLSKTYPRSPNTRFAGVFMLARTTDKARAHNAGALGPYDYGCGMDRHVLGFLGTDPDSFAKVVADLRDDAKIEAWARERLADKSNQDLETFNAEFAADTPEPGGAGERFLRGEQQRLGRDDITTWFELLDADEGRPLSRRVPA
ncbi:MAG: DUF5069 domain-containing protein [Candidatus Eremiobacteraeota bacterium]|nr:DUF5069 domain-containing protein [Candidatus Eremiobacteraeota bacterium]